MTEPGESILFVLAVFVFVIVLPLMGLARIRRGRKAKELERKAEFERRLLHPNYAAFTSHYGCEPPLLLRRLYDHRENVLDGDFNVLLPSSRRPWYVASFEPMGKGEWADIEGFYSFASDGCGNLYLVDPKVADPEVFFLDHETGKRETLGVCLSQLLEVKRTR